jgi:hypothetical protein
VFGASAVEAPGASADGAAGWVAGKLASGAGGAAADAVIGNLMAHAGLDPTTNELKAISSHLTQLSDQIKAIQESTDLTLKAVIQASLAGRSDLLEISNVTKLQGDLACYTDEKNDAKKRETCRDRFKSLASEKQLATAAGKFNDLLSNQHTTIVETYAMTLVDGKDPFFTAEDLEKTKKFYDYLDDLQVAATTLSVEARNLAASEVGPAELGRAEAVGAAEGETLEERRAAQRARNPLEKLPGTLETNLDIWLDPTTRRGPRDFESAVRIHWDGGRIWRLPSEHELLDMVKHRGSRTVKAYLVEKAGLGDALADVAEFGPTGQLWTSTARGCAQNFEGAGCRDAVSTNNAYVRTYPENSAEPKLFSFLVTHLTPQDETRYGFLLR